VQMTMGARANLQSLRVTAVGRETATRLRGILSAESRRLASVHRLHGSAASLRQGRKAPGEKYDGLGNAMTPRMALDGILPDASGALHFLQYSNGQVHGMRRDLPGSRVRQSGSVHIRFTCNEKRNRRRQAEEKAQEQRECVPMVRQ
jgi:hypothetical protein